MNNLPPETRAGHCAKSVTQGNLRDSGNLDTQESQGNLKSTDPQGSPGGGPPKKNPPPTQSLTDFLVNAVNQCVAERERKREATVWDTACFEFARRLKAHPGLGPIPAAAMLKKIEPVFRAWEREKGYDFWQEFFRVSRDSAHAEILDCWEQIRRLPGLDALSNALEFSRQNPLAIRKKIFDRRGRNETYRAFVSLCGWLQVTVGNDAIAVPCREFAELLNTDRMMISRCRKWACEDGYMEIVGKHEFNGAAADNKATTFRFHTELWACLEERDV